MITISIFVSYVILNKYIKNLSHNKSNLLIGLFIILFVLNININPKNIINFGKRFNDYIYLPDNFFLDDNEKKFITYAQNNEKFSFFKYI